MKRVIFAVLFLSLSVCYFSFSTAILIDTSRSVPKGQFEEAKKRLMEIIPLLVDKGGVTIVSFNDDAIFEAKSLTDVSSINQRIENVTQGGNYTLLYDALVKTLENFEDTNEKGIIILLSDGKDENSATEIEDVARKADVLKIPILTIGIGKEDKSLRRLPLLTKGSYLGNINSFSPKEITSVLEKAKAKEFEEKQKKEEEAKAKTQTIPLNIPQKEGKSPSFVYFLSIALILLAAAVTFFVIYLFMKRKKEEDRVCEQCGRPLSLWETECPNCFIKKISDTQPGVTTPEIKSEPKIDLDPELFKKNPTSAELDSTMVIEEIPVLLQLRGTQPPKMYQVSKETPTTIGRDKINNISLEDKTMSSQHFRIVPKDGQWFVLDLNSTNGTFVDGERIRYKEIKHGSQIHAGQNQFIFRIEQKRLS